MLHDDAMRTTLTIDDDVAAALAAEVRRSGRSLEDVVNAALRIGWGLVRGSGRAMPPFKVEPFASPFQPGVDATRLNQLFDTLATDDFLAKDLREKTP